MTGCDIIKLYYRLLADLSPPEATPLYKLQKAYELRTGNPFNAIIIKQGNHVSTIHRGMVLSILRWYYHFPLFSLRTITGYNCNQPIYRCIQLFESELTIDPTLRRDYEAIKKMLDIY